MTLLAGLKLVAALCIWLGMVSGVGFDSETAVAAVPAQAQEVAEAAIDLGKPAPTEPAASAKSEPAAAPGKAAESPDWKAFKRREDEIARREQALAELERDLDAKLSRLTELEARIKKMLDDADIMRDQKFKHLVDVYANMKAKQAAGALEKLNEDIAVKILAGMRGRQAGEVMSSMSPEKAATLSEALTRMQIPFN